MIINEIFRALGYLFISVFIFSAWKMARDHSQGGKHISVLWKGFLWCAAVALFASMTVGEPTCIDSEQDVRGTNCFEYADDGYEPTTEQRAASFAYFMTLFFIPVIVGVTGIRYDADK